MQTEWIQQNKPVIAIMGPTASGKTSLSIKLAHSLNTEVIAMDSMQVYRGMDIGTAKPTLAEMQGVPHHMLDVADPCQPYSVAEYVKGATECIESLLDNSKIPILVGGTGLYHKSLSGGFTLGGTLSDEPFRREMEAIGETPEGRAKLHRELQRVDPQTAARLHVNDLRRVIRALEVYRLTGKPISDQTQAKAPESPYHFINLGIGMERSMLIDRINLRVDQMLIDGLVQEVNCLLESGVPATAQSMQGLGYKELTPHLLEGASLNDAVEQIKTGTRQYAKRQMTWFRRTPDMNWLNGLDAQIVDHALSILKQNLPL